VIDGCVCVAWIDGGWWDVGGSMWESWWLVGCISFFAGKEISLFEIIQMSTNDKHKRQTQPTNQGHNTNNKQHYSYLVQYILRQHIHSSKCHKNT
jgi:hypothetical protein